VLTADDTEHTFDAALPTPGSHQCGGQHYAKAVHHSDGAITWRCVHCGKERVMSDGRGWR